MNLAPAQPNLWKERYETLRRHFVENRRLLGSDPLGLALLLRSGIAGWVRAWRSCTEAAPQTGAPTPDSTCPPISTASQQELTLLIAHMTARHVQASPRL